MTLSVHSSTMTSTDEEDHATSEVRQILEKDSISQVESIFKYQNAFMTASTCSSTSYSLEDDVATDVEMGLAQPAMEDAMVRFQRMMWALDMVAVANFFLGFALRH